jgi:hypothetical protein
LFETTFDLEDQGLVVPFVAIQEQLEGQQMSQVAEEMLHQNTMTATGVGADHDINKPPQAPNQPVPGQ